MRLEHDTGKADSAAGIAALHRLGIDVVLTGDNARTGAAIAVLAGCVRLERTRRYR